MLKNIVIGILIVVVAFLLLQKGISCDWNEEFYNEGVGCIHIDEIK